MNLIIDYISIKKTNRQFWLMVFVLLLSATAFANMTVDFNTMLNALQNNAGPIITFVVAIAYVMGIWFIFSAVMGLKKLGEASSSQTGGMSGPLTKLVVGVVLVYLPSTIDVSAASLWGHGILNSGYNSIISYTPTTGDPFWSC